MWQHASHRVEALGRSNRIKALPQRGSGEGAACRLVIPSRYRPSRPANDAAPKVVPRPFCRGLPAGRKVCRVGLFPSELEVLRRLRWRDALADGNQQAVQGVRQGTLAQPGNRHYRPCHPRRRDTHGSCSHLSRPPLRPRSGLRRDGRNAGGMRAARSLGRDASSRHKHPLLRFSALALSKRPDGWFYG